MMGLDIPASAFGSAWADYRIFAGLNAVVLLAFLLLGGVLGDAFGRRRVLLLGAGGPTLANVLALAAPNPPLFVVGRVLEAIRSALALPLSLALIRLTFPGRALPLALLVYPFVTALGALASLLALVIDQFVGIRATLVLPIIAGSVGTGLAWRSVPESRASGGDRVRRAVAAAALVTGPPDAGHRIDRAAAEPTFRSAVLPAQGSTAGRASNGRDITRRTPWAWRPHSNGPRWRVS
jgi:MFS family permease